MTDNQGSFQERNDDMDLAVLLARSRRFFGLYGRLILITTLLGLCLGIVLIFQSSRYYKSRMVLESTILNTTENDELIDNWNLLRTTKRYSQLQQYFNCSPQTAKDIQGLSIEPLPGLSDGTVVFALDITLKDTTQLRNIQEALLYGLRNNPYVRDKITLRKQDLQRQITEASKEITKLDSTKDYIESLSRNEKKDNDRLILDVSSISKDKVEIGEKLSSYQEKLAFGTGVQLVQGATPPRGPKPGNLTLSALGLATGFLIGYLIAIIKSMIRISKQHPH